MFPGRVLWATLHAIDDDDLGVAQRAENAATIARMGMAQFALACAAIDAVVLGRTGDREARRRSMADVRARMRQPPAQLRGCMHVAASCSSRGRPCATGGATR